MRLRTRIAGPAALVLAAGCSMAPAPMTRAERTALADTLSQVVTDMFASLKKDASADKLLGYYVRGNDLVMAENGVILPNSDSLARVLRSVYAPGTRVAITFDQQHVTVLDRDNVVFTALLNVVFKPAASNEMPVENEAWTGVYHRTPEGWKIAAEHVSTRPPARAPAAPAKPTRPER